MKHQILRIIKNVIPDFDKANFDEDFKDAGVDSIDLVTIRVELEKLIHYEFSDKAWFQFNSFEEIVNFINENDLKIVAKASVSKIFKEDRAVEISMPQMANSTLSENWLFKEMGDIHWNLICQGLSLKSAEIFDEFGDRLYATFIHIQINIHNALSNFKENDILILKGNISRYGENIYETQIDSVQGINAQLISSFTKRAKDNNSTLQKSNPFTKQNKIQETSLPKSLQEYKLIRKKLVNGVELDGYKFEYSDNCLFKYQYTINPYYEINGVGLLYFASYPIINDSCESYFFKEKKNDEYLEYATNARKVIYLANCDQNDSIIYELNSMEKYKNKIYTQSNLYRKSDLHKIAKIFTVKEK